MLKGGGGAFPDEHEIRLRFVQLYWIWRRCELDEIDTPAVFRGTAALTGRAGLGPDTTRGSNPVVGWGYGW